MTTKKKQPGETAIERNICSALDQTLTLNDTTLTRLADIRQQALAELPAQDCNRPRNLWIISASGVAVCAVLAIVLLLPPPHRNIDQRVTELEWLINNEDLTMMEAEFEFYEWAVSEMDSSG